MKNILKQLILENQDYIANLKIQERDYHIEKGANYVFVGSRRAGKSFLMYKIAQDFIKIHQKESILFINFEDERFMEFNVANFNLLMEAYNELFDLKPLLFLDEIQNIKGWEKFVRRLADKDYRVYITGSNAQMLSNEIASTLGGRFLIKEIHTLSFKEFIRFNHLQLDINYEFKHQKIKVKRLMEEYFRYGGYPELLKYTNKREYLSSLFKQVLYGDIVARHNIKNKQAMNLLIKKMAENVNDETSFNRIKNLIKSTGASIGTNTIIEYFDFLKDGFLLFDVKNYASKFTEKETKKKFYFNDNGILALFFPDDVSKLLENMVFSELKRRFLDDFYYHKKKYETDFYIPEQNELIQVAYSLHEQKTKERELRSLEKSMDELGSQKGYIITYDYKEENIKLNNKSIDIIPLWKWLLR